MPVLPLLLLLVAAAAAENYSRADFPDGFVFGSGTSAYQYEGAAFDDGRSLSIWDTFLHSRGMPTGDVTCDGYHKFKDDVKWMSEVGLEAFRFSFSWSRLIPNGRGPVNPLGVQFYNDFINELVAHGIQPHASLTHFDLPQVLEDEYDGWLDRRIVEDFTAYADVCFKEFGDRVKFWTTVNEANIFAMGSYSQGITPPGRCSPSVRPGCIGNSSTEPYIVGHNILLAHSATWKLYQDKYKAAQQGQVGFNLYSFGMSPWSDEQEDVIATQRGLDFYVGWLLDPLVHGRYPESVSERARGRLPIFSEDESKQLKGAFDFLGVNYYVGVQVSNDPTIVDANKWDLQADIAVQVSVPGFAAGQLPADGYPLESSSFISFMGYLKDSYGNPPIYIHENGQTGPRTQNLSDTARAEYIDTYIHATLSAIRNGSNIKGYMYWTFMDCLELLNGYSSAFGLFYVDLDDKDLKRYPKFSARWYSDFVNGGSSRTSYVITDKPSQGREEGLSTPV